MAYKTVQAMVDAINLYDSDISNISDTFKVHGDYLINGMNTDDFVSGYKAYHGLIKRLNTDMVAEPDRFDLVLPDKKGVMKPVNSFNIPFLWLFIALGRSGEVKGGVLHVNGGEFFAYARGKTLGAINAYPRNIAAMMRQLSDYGFVIQGYRYGEANDFTVEHTESPQMLAVIKASTLSRYQEKSIVCDYACFNAAMFATAPKERMPFADTHTAKMMPPELVAQVNTIISAFTTIGLSPNAERHHKPHEGWMKFGTYFQFYYNPWRIHAILNIHDVRKHFDYLSSLPKKYMQIIANHLKCRGCCCKNEKCPRKHMENTPIKCIGCGYPGSECARRCTDVIFGEKRIWCAGSYLMVNFPTEADDIAVAVNIIAHVNGKKRKGAKN